MLVGLDNFLTYLAEPALQGATTLRLITSTAACAAAAGGNHTYLKLSDGTLDRVVKITGCTGTVVNLAAPLDASFSKGSCARYVLTTQIVCELMAQGSCAVAATATTCTPATIIAGKIIPDIVIGEPFQWVIAIGGTAPFTVNALLTPSWMNITPIGVTSATSIVLSGTPMDGTALSLQLLISGCNSSRVEMVQRLCYCEAAGVQNPP